MPYMIPIKKEHPNTQKQTVTVILTSFLIVEE